MSKTGKHRRITKVFILSREGDITTPKLLNHWSCSGTYKVGKSICGYVSIEEPNYLLLIELTLNWRGNAKGYINIIDSTGSKVLSVKYVNKKLRYVSGDKTLIYLVNTSLAKIIGEIAWKNRRF
jgi:hypothetical protein